MKKFMLGLFVVGMILFLGLPPVQAEGLGGGKQGYIENGHLFVSPIDVLAIFDVSYTWKEELEMVRLEHDDQVVVLGVDEGDVKVNGETVPNAAPAIVVDNQLYVPLRAVGEALGLEIVWNPDEVLIQTVDMKRSMTIGVPSVDVIHWTELRL